MFTRQLISFQEHFHLLVISKAAVMLVTLGWWQFQDVGNRIIMIAPFHYVSDFYGGHPFYSWFGCRGGLTRSEDFSFSILAHRKSGIKNIFDVIHAMRGPWEYWYLVRYGFFSQITNQESKHEPNHWVSYQNFVPCTEPNNIVPKSRTTVPIRTGTVIWFGTIIHDTGIKRIPPWRICHQHLKLFPLSVTKISIADIET